MVEAAEVVVPPLLLTKEKAEVVEEAERLLASADLVVSACPVQMAQMVL
jgi:hypothetical protein